MKSRHLTTGLTGAFVVLLAFTVLRLFLAPDPGANWFARAQQLESANETARALKHYQLISDRHPESFYAPRALARQGDILAAKGREINDRSAFKAALEAYNRLATNYPKDPLAVEALLNAGRIAAENLGDRKAAQMAYERVLERFGGNPDYASLATLKLGRLALNAGDGKTAQMMLQKVLQNWPRLTERAAEAQYHLGVTYETLLKNRVWAQNAYDATIARYPNSTWANDARERLGLLVYTMTGGRRPARRVSIQISPLPDEGAADGSLWAALKPILAARGLETDAVQRRGLSLEPFYCGFDADNPAKVVEAPFDAFENVLANAGLRFSIKSGGEQAAALRDLQDEIDAARAPLVYTEEGGKGHWRVATGYDSERNEVMLQNRGARFDTLAVKAFAAQWAAKSPLGDEFTLVSFIGGAKTKAPTPSLTPTPIPTAMPGQTPEPQIMGPPSFVWQLPQLSAPNAHRRALQRAAQLLNRPKQGKIWLNIAALEHLGGVLERAAEAQNAPIPVAEPTPTPDPASPYLPDPTPEPTPNADRIAALEAGRKSLPFFAEPVRKWVVKRREAAAYLDEIAPIVKNSSLKAAAKSLRESADNLEAASNSTDYANLAQLVKRASDAERRAAAAM